MKIIHPFILVILISISTCSTPANEEEANKKIAISYYEEVVNQRNLERVEKIFAAGYVDHEMGGTKNKSIENKTMVPFLEYLFNFMFNNSGV